MPSTIRPDELEDFDPAAYLDTPESQQKLMDAFETGDRAYISDAIRIIARARGA